LIGIASSLSLSSQNLVDTTQSENKNVFLEEYTGRNCGYCPDGHKIANDIKVANPNDVVLMRVHTGGYAPSSYPNFNTSFGSPLAGQSGINGFPTGTINRHVFSGSSTSMSRSAWNSVSNQVLAETAIVNIGMNAVVDTANRNLFVEVELYYTGSQTVSCNKNMLSSSFNQSKNIIKNRLILFKQILKNSLRAIFFSKAQTVNANF
jgi:hypothetical protein